MTVPRQQPYQRQEQQQERQERQGEQQQQQQQPTVVRLSWALVAHDACHEQLYQQSQEAQAFIAMVDTCGLLMAFFSNVALMVAAHWGGKASSRSSVPAVVLICSVMALSLLQLAYAKVAWRFYYRQRNRITIANRVLRAVACMGPALRHKFSVPTAWIQPGQATAGALAAVVTMGPLAHFHISLNLMLPTRYAVVAQLVAVFVSAAWVFNTPAALQQMPGMHAVARSTCGTLRSLFDLVLYVLCDLGTIMPAVPAAKGVNSFGLPSLCERSNEHVFSLLLLYPNLLLSYAAPLFVGFVIELHAKLSFWRSKPGVVLVLDRSPLLPLPESIWVSHALVALAAPVVLFYLAEQLAPWTSAPSLQQQPAVVGDIGPLGHQYCNTTL